MVGGAARRPDPSPTVHLLQAYDEYVVAYRETRDVADVAGLAGGRMPFVNTVMVDGQFAGGWKRALTARDMTIEVRPARPFDDAEQAALGAAVDTYARFVGLPTTLAVRDV